MNKIFFGISFILGISLTNVEASDIDIYKVMVNYGIDYRVKENIGWDRVCNNNKLKIYSNKILSDHDIKFICKFIKKLSKNKDRTIGSFLIERSR